MSCAAVQINIPDARLDCLVDEIISCLERYRPVVRIRYFGTITKDDAVLEDDVAAGFQRQLAAGPAAGADAQIQRLKRRDVDAAAGLKKDAGKTGEGGKCIGGQRPITSIIITKSRIIKYVATGGTSPGPVEQ